MDRVGGRRGAAKGKLTEAARIWALAMVGAVDPSRPVELDDQDVAAFADLGVTFEGAAVEADADDYGVWDVNWTSLKAFLACETQWRVTVAFHQGAEVRRVRHGLDYAGVDVVLTRLFGYLKAKARRMLFADLQAMEASALGAWAEVRHG